jgi:AcrR family transcriptional regulator
LDHGIADILDNERHSMSAPKTKRARDPEATREVILDAARTLLAKDGPEGISLSEVAHLAGVNRGTAYQHFATREKLIEATALSVSNKMFRAVFGDPATIGERQVDQVDIAEPTDRIAEFAMENPALCRVWLLQLLASPDPANDPFWREYQGSIARFAATERAQDNIDTEALSVMLLAGSMMWPIWARSHARDDDDRRGLAQRFAMEVLRLCMHGSVKPEYYPEIEQRLTGKRPVPVKLRAIK